MDNFLDKLSKFLFGKYLKLFLLVIGIIVSLIGTSYYRSDGYLTGMNIRLGITGIGLIFSAIYLHSHSK